LFVVFEGLAFESFFLFFVLQGKLFRRKGKLKPILFVIPLSIFLTLSDWFFVFPKREKRSFFQFFQFFNGRDDLRSILRRKKKEEKKKKKKKKKNLPGNKSITL